MTGVLSSSAAEGASLRSADEPIHAASYPVMGNGASGVVDELNVRLKPPLVAEALVIAGLVGPDTDARISRYRAAAKAVP